MSIEPSRSFQFEIIPLVIHNMRFQLLNGKSSMFLMCTLFVTFTVVFCELTAIKSGDPEPRRRRADDPLSEYVEKMSTVARITNAIYLQAGIMNGSIPLEDAVAELLNFGTLTVDDVVKYKADGVSEALGKLAAVSTSIDSTDEAKTFEGYIVYLHRIRNEKDTVTAQTEVDSYFKEVGMLKDRALDTSAFDASENIFGELLEDLESLLNIKVSVKKFDEATLIKALNLKINKAETFLVALDAIRQNVSHFQKVGQGSEVLEPVRKLLEFSKMTTEMGSRLIKGADAVLQSVLIGVAEVSKLSSSFKSVAEDLSKIRTLTVSQLQREQIPRKFTPGFLHGLEDMARLSTNFRDSWTRTALDIQKNTSKFETGLKPSLMISDQMRPASELHPSLSKTSSVESVKHVAELGDKLMQINATSQQVKTLFDQFVECVKSNSIFHVPQDFADRETLLKNADNLQMSFNLIKDSLDFYSEEYIQKISTFLNEIEAKIQFSVPDNVNTEEVPKMIEALNSLPSSTKEQWIEELKESSTRLPTRNKLGLDLHKLAGSIDFPFSDGFQNHKEAQSKSKVKECLSRSEPSDDVVSALELIEKLRQPVHKVNEVEVANKVVKQVSEKLTKMVAAIAKSLRSENSEDVLELNLLPTRSTNASQVIGETAKGFRNVENFDAIKPTIDFLKAEGDFVSDRITRLAHRARRSASSIQQKWGNHTNDWALLESVWRQVDDFKSRVHSSDFEKLTSFATRLADAQKSGSVPWDPKEKVDAVAMLIDRTDNQTDRGRLVKVKESLEELGRLDLKFANYHRSFAAAPSALSSLSRFFSDFFRPPLSHRTRFPDNSNATQAASRTASSEDTTSWFSNNWWILVVGGVVLVSGAAAFGAYKKIGRRRVKQQFVSLKHVFFPTKWDKVAEWTRRFQYKTSLDARKDLESIISFFTCPVETSDCPSKNRTDIGINKKTSVAGIMNLGPDDKNYWINANEITTVKGQRIRVCQAPQLANPWESKVNTHDDFWRMVWNDRTNLIVQLGNPSERGENFCCYPIPGTYVSSYFHVTVKKRTEVKSEKDADKVCIIERVIEIDDRRDKTKKTKPREVVHWEYLGWEEHDVPASPEIVYQVWNRVEARKSTSPIVIYCKTGHGRSVMFAAVKFFSDVVARTPHVTFEEIAKEFSELRFKGIRNIAEIYFIILATVYKLNKDRNPKNMSSYEKVKAMYDELLPTLLLEIPNRRREWKDVQLWIERHKMYNQSSNVDYFFGFELARRPLVEDLREKERRKMYDTQSISKATAVKITDLKGDRVWINASDIVTRAGTVFRVTQSPLDGTIPDTDNTIEDFWLMVFQGKSKYVVQLCHTGEPLEENFKVAAYVPAPENTLKLSRFCVTNLGEKLEGNILEKILTVEDTATNEVHQVIHMTLNEWFEPAPECVETTVDIVRQVSISKTPIVVVCATGNGKSVAFAGIEYAARAVERSPDTDLIPILIELITARHNSLDSYIHNQFILSATPLLLALDYEKPTDDYKKMKGQYGFMRGKFLREETNRFERRMRAKAAKKTKVAKKEKKKKT